MEHSWKGTWTKHRRTRTILSNSIQPGQCPISNCCPRHVHHHSAAPMTKSRFPVNLGVRFVHRTRIPESTAVALGKQFTGFLASFTGLRKLALHFGDTNQMNIHPSGNFPFSCPVQELDIVIRDCTNVDIICKAFFDVIHFPQASSMKLRFHIRLSNTNTRYSTINTVFLATFRDVSLFPKLSYQADHLRSSGTFRP